MDIAAFRTNFPEFADAATYPDGQITFYSDLGEGMLVRSRWGNKWGYGVQLYTAHYLTIARQNLIASQAGGVPGGSSGPQQSKSLGAASVSYDTGSVMDPKAHQWNATSYGRILWGLILLFGAGGLQV